jgi:hypothetical protein
MANEAADQEGRKFEVFRQIKGRALGWGFSKETKTES